MPNPDNQIEEIKQKVDVVELVQSYFPLQKAGKNYRARCPFHSEKTPSFMVSPQLQIYKCFGCGQGGDVFSFVQEMEGIDFGESLRILADRAGVKLKSYRSSPEQSQRERLYEINHLAAEFFHFLLTQHRVGRRALDYFHRRGIKDETIKQFKLGYSPDSWDSLGKYLLSKDYRLTEIITAGLCLPKGGGRRFYDRFRGRVVFPLIDHRSRVAGFSGRVLEAEADQPKYLNTPETPVFKKGQFLYGLNLSKRAIKEAGEAVLVEGQMDLISPFQAGVQNIVASSGTSLSVGQIRLVKRYADSVIFCFDSDSAGEAASQRGIELFEGEGVNVKVAVLPPGVKDPDEAVRQDLAAFRKSLKNSVSIFDFYFQIAFAKWDAQASLGAKRISSFLLPKIASVGDAIQKDRYVSRLATELNVSATVVYQALARYTAAGERDRAGTVLIGPEVSRPKLGECMLAQLFKAPLEVSQTVAHKLGQKDFPQLESRQIFAAFKEYVSGRKRAVDLKVFAARLDEPLAKRVAEIYLWDLGQLEEEEFEEGLRREIDKTVKVLKRETVKRELKDLGREIKSAEKEGKDKELKRLQKEFKELSEKLVEE
ncbi:DNA primase [Candidatus Parcubacteria bacterium]|nr:DNA primase [Candidatus Parcubacteria bacterium]